MPRCAAGICELNETADASEAECWACGDGECSGNEGLLQCSTDFARDGTRTDFAAQVIGFVDHVSLRNGEWFVGSRSSHVGWSFSVAVNEYV